MNPLSLYPRQSLDGLHGHQTASASSKLLSYQHASKVDDLAYLPGEPRFVGGLLNIWTASPLTPVARPWPNIQALLEHQFPVEEQREHVLDYVAFLAQKPKSKIKHALVIRGHQGAGKNTFFCEVVSPIVGRGNHRVLGGEALLSRFNIELVNVQVLVVDETMHRDGWDVANAIKPVVTEDRIPAEAKGQDRRLATTPRAIIVLSNERVPLPLEVGDRRFYVPDYGPERLEAAFYEAVHQALPKEIPAFYAALLARDVSHFNPSAPPPTTAGKMEMQAAVRPPVERQLCDWLEDRWGPFSHDIVIPAVLLRELREAGYAHVNEGALGRALKAIGAQSLGQLPAHANWLGRPRCWAIRNSAYWQGLSPTAWAQHLLSIGGPAASDVGEKGKN